MVLGDMVVLSEGSEFLILGFQLQNPKPQTRLSLPVFNWIAIDVGFVDGCGGFDIVFPRKVILR